MLPALVFALIACLIFATATSVAALIVARLLTGMAVGAVVSAGMAAVTDVGGPERRRTAALLASCAMVFGAGLGPFLAGVLSETMPAPTVTVFVVEATLLVTAVFAVLRMPIRSPLSPPKGAWVRVPAVPQGGGRELTLEIAVFAPGIAATSFVLSLGPSLLSGLLGSTSRIIAGAMAFAMFLSSVPPQRLAEANAALNVGGYVFAGALPVSAGYLSDAVGLTNGATVFGVALMVLAAIGGLVVLAGWRQVAERA
ncbi:MFS transporter [Streptomyces sp. or43]|nr:MFS transporter [Streptomyces sp. or43]